MKLASNLPKATDKNGLAYVENQLISSPVDPILMIIQVDCKKLETNIATGEVFATGQIISIEPIIEPGDIMRAFMVQLRAREARLNASNASPIPGLSPADLEDMKGLLPPTEPTETEDDEVGESDG